MTDLLAGRREAINEGKAFSLVWLDEGKGCPVEVGQLFTLRACRIEITKTHRIQKKLDWEFEGDVLLAGWYWRAEFATYRRLVRQRYLAKRGGTTTDRKQAMAAQDDPEPGTLRVIGEEERDPVAATQHAQLGDAPEASVPHHEVPDYGASRDADQLYKLAHAERRVAEASAPLEERIERLREMSRVRHIDISGDLKLIEKRVAAVERKILEGAAAA